MKIFRKTGVATLINIIGMAVALAAAMILLVQVRWDAGYDANFTGSERVFQIENNWMDGGAYSTFISRPIIEIVKTSSPNIEAVGTANTTGRGGNNVYYPEEDKDGALTVPCVEADSTFLTIYPFEWVEGSPKDFSTAGTAVINEDFAKMFFGSESAIGKTLTEGTGGYKVQIVAVFKNTPRNSSFHYGLMENIGKQNIDNNSEWSYNAFVKLKDPSQATETAEVMRENILQFISGGDPEDTTEEQLAAFRSGFRLSNLHKAHFERDVRAGTPSVNKAITITLLAIAILLIIIALINFINFAFAEIPFRIKDINTRKVLGESRGSLVRRQLMHAVVIALVAFALAVLLMYAVSGTFWASFVSDSIKPSDNPGIVLITLCVAIVTAMAAGIAPALYSTSQPAALVLKGSYGLSVRGRSLRKGLVAIQYILSFIFMLMALYVSVQTKFMIGRDMGFSEADVLQVWCGQRAGNQKDALKDKLLQNPSIADVTFSDNLIVTDQIMGWGRTGEDGKQIFLEVLPVDDNFVKFFNLHIVEGRDFLPSDAQSEDGCFIVNENFIEKYPQFRVGSLMGGHESEETEIVGVVKDFNFKSLQHPLSPMALYSWGKNPWRPFSFIYVRTVPGADFKDVSKYIQEAVCAFDPVREPDQMTVRHLDEWIRNMYSSEESLGKLITAASFIALLIAIIGIIGLVFFETQYMRKEIAVRRVNGATVESILAAINKKYLAIAAVSFVVSVPFALWIILGWRKNFAYQAPVPLWIFAVALIAVALITAIVVTLQSLRAASANPVDSLKSE